MAGFIKLHKKIKEWEWYKEPLTKAVFLHLLLNANYEPSKYKGYDINIGDCIFGRKQFAEDLGISEQSIRTSITHLKSTNEITIKSTNKFSIITLMNYGKYRDKDIKTNQQNNQQSNIQLTNNQPTTNHIKEYKNIRTKEEKEIYINIYKEKVESYTDNDELRKAIYDYLDMRKEKKKEPTLNALTLILKKADKLVSTSTDKIEIFEQSTMNGWTDIYKIDNGKNLIYKKSSNPFLDEEV